MHALAEGGSSAASATGRNAAATDGLQAVPYNSNMKICGWTFAILALFTGIACAQEQAPVEDRSRSLQQGQYRAGIAYRELEQARHDAKFAEQDVLNLRDAHAAAQQQAEARKHDLDAAQKALDAARARLAAAQQAYDREVNAIDAAHRAAPAAGSVK